MNPNNNSLVRLFSFHMPAGGQRLLEYGADGGVDGAEEDVEVLGALDLDQGEELVGLHTRLLLLGVACATIHKLRETEPQQHD